MSMEFRGFRARREGRLVLDDGPVELGEVWFDGADNAQPDRPAANGQAGLAARFRAARGAAAAPAAAPPPTPDGEIDTSHNPHTRSRPIAGLFTQPLSLAGMVLAVVWIFLVRDYWVFLATSGMVIGVLALGLMVLVGWVREVTLASGAVFGTSLYIGSYMYREGDYGFGFPLLVAVGVSILVGASMMLAVSFASVRFSGVYTMVFTLGVQIMVERVIYTRYHLVGGGDVALSNPRPSFFGYTFEGDDRMFYLFLLVCIAFVLALLQRLRFSPYGRAMMLVGADQAAAAAVGVNPYKAKALGFGICGALAGFSGILAAMLYVSAPSTFNYTATTSLLWLSIAILGGFDSMVAVLGVACLFQGVPFLLERFHVNYQMLAGLSLFIGVMAGARGIGGTLKDLKRRIRYGPAARRVAARTTFSAASVSVLERGDGLTDLHAIGPRGAVREQALETLMEWFPPRRTDPIALRADDVWLSFGGVNALRGASLTVPTGTFTGLIGPNGAGKTTLFDVLSGLQRADRGTVRIFEEDVTRNHSWTRAGVGLTRTFQTTRVMKDLPLSDNLLAGAGLRIDSNLGQFLAGSRRAWREVREAEEAAWAIAQLLDISRYWDERVGQLEFSARRRSELGRALLSGPQILLLDEPTSGLDPASSGALISLVRQLQQELGLTVLLVEHYVKAVLEGCDYVYVLAQGEILAHGEPAAVAANPDVQERYLGTSTNASAVPWRERAGALPKIESRV